jgi:hypothetical protein
MKPPKKRNPIARALRTLRRQIIQDKRKYNRRQDRKIERLLTTHGIHNPER